MKFHVILKENLNLREMGPWRCKVQFPKICKSTFSHLPELMHHSILAHDENKPSNDGYIGLESEPQIFKEKENLQKSCTETISQLTFGNAKEIENSQNNKV